MSKNKMIVQKTSFFVLMLLLTFSLSACFKKENKQSNDLWEENDKISEEKEVESSTRGRLSGADDAEAEEKRIMKAKIPKDKKSLDKLLRDLERAAKKDSTVQISKDDLDKGLEDEEEEDIFADDERDDLGSDLPEDDN